MTVSPASNPPSAVLDASLIIGFCAREADKYAVAKSKLDDYTARGFRLYAPGIVVGEVLFVLCGKLKDGSLTAAEHLQATNSFAVLMSAIDHPPRGDGSLVDRAEQIRATYGCSRANDAIYLALTEQLAANGQAELVTFDAGMRNQAQANAPIVNVQVIPTASAAHP
jgi:predicted nucleic acid-binding protein